MDLVKPVQDFVIENFLFGDSEGIDNSTSFLDSGIIDSTGILELIAFLEENYNITIDDDELIPENFNTLDNIGEYLKTKLQS